MFCLCFSLTSLQPPALPTTFLFSVLRASTFLLRAPPVPSGQVSVPERPAAFPSLKAIASGTFGVPLSHHHPQAVQGVLSCPGAQPGNKLMNQGLAGSKTHSPSPQNQGRAEMELSLFEKKGIKLTKRQIQCVGIS